MTVILVLYTTISTVQFLQVFTKIKTQYLGAVIVIFAIDDLLYASALSIIDK